MKKLLLSYFLFFISILILSKDLFSQNVGIGSVAPLHKLEVIDPGADKILSLFKNTGGYGEINISNETGLVNLGVVTGGGNTAGYVGTNTPNDFLIRTGGVWKIYIQHTNGNVGIGTPGKPMEKLDVNGNIKLSGKILNEAVQTAVLFAGWSNLAGYTPAAFYKDKEGRVHLSGMVNFPSGPSSGTTIFNLPEGYRPNGRIVFSVLNSGVIGRLDVLANGNLSVFTGSTGYMSLDGISFRAD